jgi:hypothetical protein
LRLFGVLYHGREVSLLAGRIHSRCMLCTGRRGT